MKKYLLILAAMLFCVTSNVNAGKKKPIIIIVQNPPITPQSPQTGTSPLIRGEYDAEELTLIIEDYDGDATITIEDATTHQVVYSGNEIVVSPAIININLSTLPSSTYIIYIELDNGDCYYGTIQL